MKQSDRIEALWDLWRENIRRRADAPMGRLPALLAERDEIRNALIQLKEISPPSDYQPLSEKRLHIRATQKAYREKRARRQRLMMMRESSESGLSS